MVDRRRTPHAALNRSASPAGRARVHTVTIISHGSLSRRAGSIWLGRKLWQQVAAPHMHARWPCFWLAGRCQGAGQGRHGTVPLPWTTHRDRSRCRITGRPLLRPPSPATPPRHDFHMVLPGAGERSIGRRYVLRRRSSEQRTVSRRESNDSKVNCSATRQWHVQYTSSSQV